MEHLPSSQRIILPLHNTDEKRALTVKEFCTAFGVSRTFFYAEVTAGRIHIRKAGRRTLVARADAEAWFRALPRGPANDLGSNRPKLGDE